MALTIQSHQGALFQNQGYLISGLSWAHITIDIDLKIFETDLERYQNFIKYFDTLASIAPGSKTKYSDEERRRMTVLKRLCQRKFAKMSNALDELKADLRSPDALRQKRQIAVGIAAIGGIIVGAITGSLFSQFKTTALVDILEKRVGTITTQVERNTIAVFQDTEDIKRINRTLIELEEGIGNLLMRDVTFEHYFTGIYSTLLLEEQADRFGKMEEAVDHLLLGKMHKGLVSTDGLINALARIRQKALMKGLLVGVQRPLELYQLPTSFIYNVDSKIIQAILHIPIYRESHILSLHRYLPTPFKIPDVEPFVIIKPSHLYLARSPDGNLLKTLTETDLAACLTIGHAYFCADHAMKKPTKSNCLLNLFSGINSQDLKTCDVHFHPTVSEIEQLNGNQYLISDTSKLFISTTCYSAPASKPVTVEPGTYIITVDSNCTTSSSNWVINPNVQIDDTVVQSTIIAFNTNITDLIVDVDLEDLKTIKDSLKEIGQPIPLSHIKQLTTFKRTIAAEVAAYNLTHLVLGTSSTMGVTLLVFGIVIYCWYTRRPQLHQHQFRTTYIHGPQTSRTPSPRPHSPRTERDEPSSIPLINFPIRHQPEEM